MHDFPKIAAQVRGARALVGLNPIWQKVSVFVV